MNPEKLLSLEHALLVLDQVAEPSGDPRIPQILFQYWDRSPPDQVATLLARNRDLCAMVRVEYRFFDDDSARDLIAGAFDANVLQAYDLSPHPAMKSDLFRLCFLHEYGGFYLDADMVLREGFERLYAIAGDVVVFKWNVPERKNICNWLVGSVARSPSIRFVLDAAVGSVLRACRADPGKALRNILGVSGPGLFTRAVATVVAGDPLPKLFAVRSVDEAYTMVQNGPEYLHQRLAYKSTALHWLVAGNSQTQP